MRTTILKAAAAAAVGALALTGCTDSSKPLGREELVRELKAEMAKADVTLNDVTKGTRSERPNNVTLLAPFPGASAEQAMTAGLAELEKAGWKREPASKDSDGHSFHLNSKDGWTVYTTLGGPEMSDRLKTDEKVITMTALHKQSDGDKAP